MISLNECVSSVSEYCDGYQNPGASGKGYILALTLGIGVAELVLGHKGESRLDGINAFDRAETDDVFIGQINMITVSSFCGLNGNLLGYDLLKSEDLFFKHECFPEAVLSRHDGGVTNIYSAAPLIDASRELFGTVDAKRFPLIPGGHIPCAEKSYKKIGPARIYSGIAIAIPEDRERNACLMMEDVGEIPLEIGEAQIDKYKRQLVVNLAQSALFVGENQRVRYKEIFVQVKQRFVGDGKIGCALVASPYFTIAKNAVPNNSPEGLRDISLQNWVKIFS